MALKDLLVCIDASSTAEHHLKLAFDLARSQRAHLSAAYVIPQPEALVAHPPAGVVPPGSLTGLGPAGMVPDGIAAEVTREAEVAEAVEQRFRSELQLNGIAGEWHLFDAGEEAELIELAKTVDMTITGQLSPERHATEFRPEDVVLGTARPVLVIPYAGTFSSVGRCVLVAWDGSREAVRAVNDALPLLANAEAVTVMFVGALSAEQSRLSLQRIVGHLQRHEILAKPEEAPGGDIATSDVLLSRAADLGADLLVAGLYHHSQLREAIVGGVSRELLEHMTVPVLMSH